MKTIIAVLITLLSIALLTIIYVFSGFFDPSALKPHGKLTLWVINKTMDNSVERRTKKIEAHDLSDTSLIKEGFGHYNEMCAICHSAPGLERTKISTGLYPKPPLLYKYASKMDPKETFWIIKNGLKMTGMPAFAPTHDDQKIWAMTAFLIKKLESMKPEEIKDWQKEYNLMK